MSVISAGTTLTTALVQTGDTNGNLVFKTGASGTTALTLGSDQSATFAGAVSFGSSAFGLGSAGAPSITFTGDTNTGIFSPGADTIAFTEGGVESVRINSSGNMGIGTNNPTARLTVNGGTGTSQTRFEVNTTEVQEVATNAAQDAYANRLADAAQHIWKITGTERMRIDSSGNLGIGSGSSNRLNLTYDPANGGATIGPNSTGGSTYLTLGTSNAGSYSERMRITSAGDVGIGTSSPSAKLQVEAPTAQLYLTSSTGTNLCLYRAINTGGTFFIGRENSTGSNFGIAYSALLWSTGAYPMVFATNDVARMRIASDGGIFSQPTGGGTLLEQFGCRAWVNFNGKNTPAIRASGNMSSITDDGTGQYRVNFTTAMPDVNFAVIASASDSTSYSGYHISSAIGNDSTGSARVWTGWTGGAADQGWVYIAIFR